MRYLQFIFILLSIFATIIAKAGEVRNFDKPHIPGQLIVKFKNQATLSILSTLGAEVKDTFHSNNAMLVEFSSINGALSTYSMAQNLAARDDVEYVEANTILSINSQEMPNDTHFSKLWGLHNLGRNGGQNDADIDAFEAWQINKGSKDVLVAIIDTGIVLSHPDLVDNIWQNPGETGVDASGNDKSTNGIDDDGNGYVDDTNGWDFVENDNKPQDGNGHGTHCAGTIGAVGGNSLGVVGVNWEVSLIALKFLNKSGNGAISDAIKAVEYATKMGVHVMSNSWGGGGFSQTMFSAIQKANEAGIVFVAAAGNSASDNNIVAHYPSNYQVENVIAVAATDSSDRLASFSNWGSQTVHLGAPGVNIYSTHLSDGYAYLSGTSMATPHVTGAIALIKSKFPALRAKELKDKLLYNVDPVLSLNGKTKTGGRLNILQALADEEKEPPTVSDLQVVSVGSSDAVLKWQNSYETQTGRIIAKIKTSPIESESDWQNAMTVAYEMLGSDEARIKNLPFNFVGYVAIRSVNSRGSVSDLSNSVLLELNKVIMKDFYDGSSMDDVNATGYWNIETVDGRQVFSDSPQGAYKVNQNASLTLLPFEKKSNNIQIILNARFHFEKNYDFGYVELSVDNGKTWRQVRQFTNQTEGWQTIKIDLQSYIRGYADGTMLNIRFRMTSDYSINKDGWLIDDIAIVNSDV